MKRLALILALASCGKPCYETGYGNYTSYPEPDTSIPEAQAVIDRVLACLEPLKTTWLSPEEAAEAQCYGTPDIRQKSCLRVAIPPDWRVSACSGEQVFPCQVPDASCLQKGQTPTAQCPCMCRAMIQDDTTVWTTPNLKLLPAYLTTLLTGCRNPWTPTLAKCASPSLANP